MPVREERSEFRFYLTTECVHMVALPVLTPNAARCVADDLLPWRGDSLENDDTCQINRMVAEDVFGPVGLVLEFRHEWGSAAVMDLARRMYKSRDFGAMPALAEALRAAGCNNVDVLNHCRNAGPHVRGCWLLDLLMAN
jgi:hypothetical protein